MKKSLIYYFISLFLVKQTKFADELAGTICFLCVQHGKQRFSSITLVFCTITCLDLYFDMEMEKNQGTPGAFLTLFWSRFLGISIFQCSVERKFKFDAKFWSVVNFNFGWNLIFILDCPLFKAWNSFKLKLQLMSRVQHLFVKTFKFKF